MGPLVTVTAVPGQDPAWPTVYEQIGGMLVPYNPGPNRALAEGRNGGD